MDAKGMMNSDLETLEEKLQILKSKMGQEEYETIRKEIDEIRKLGADLPDSGYMASVNDIIKRVVDLEVSSFSDKTLKETIKEVKKEGFLAKLEYIKLCAREGKDIVLLTKGNGRHPYLYSAQAVTAILCVLLKGEKGETYNAANPDTYCSIYEMGKMVADTIADGKISVRIEESDANRKYPPASCLNLSIDKITKLGWKPQGTLADMYKRMIAVMR